MPGPSVPTRTTGEPYAPSVSDIAILPQGSTALLRQEIAAKLMSFGDAVMIRRARFTVFVDQIVGDLSGLPVPFRGSLSGPGGFTADITITKEGRFTKAELEAMAERLPALPNAVYGARLDVTGAVQDENA
jgi:hypothetical protein